MLDVRENRWTGGVSFLEHRDTGRGMTERITAAPGQNYANQKYPHYDQNLPTSLTTCPLITRPVKCPTVAAAKHD